MRGDGVVHEEASRGLDGRAGRDRVCRDPDPDRFARAAPAVLAGVAQVRDERQGPCAQAQQAGADGSAVSLKPDEAPHATANLLHQAPSTAPGTRRPWPPDR